MASFKPHIPNPITAALGFFAIPRTITPRATRKGSTNSNRPFDCRKWGCFWRDRFREQLLPLDANKIANDRVENPWLKLLKPLKGAEANSKWGKEATHRLSDLEHWQASGYLSRDQRCMHALETPPTTPSWRKLCPDGQGAICVHRHGRRRWQALCNSVVLNGIGWSYFWKFDRARSRSM